MKNIEDYKRSLGDETFNLWHQVAKKKASLTGRNFEVECSILVAEPINEGLDSTQANELLVRVVKRAEEAILNG